MDPSKGQNLSNLIFLLGSVLGLSAPLIGYYLNFRTKGKRRRQRKNWLKLGYIATFFGAVITILARFALSYFDSQADLIKPYRQPVQSAMAAVQVFVRSSNPVDSGYLQYGDKGGYLAFMRGTQLLLGTSAINSLGRQGSADQYEYRGTFQMDPAARASNLNVNDLRQAQYIQIAFAAMPQETYVIKGQAVVTINASVQLEIPIPEQDVKNGLILVSDLKEVFKDFK
jgi:hypothetical protein